MKNTSRSFVRHASRWCTVRALSSVILVGALILALNPARLQAATNTWDGGDSATNHWAADLNWNPDSAPVDGDSLVFAGVTRLNHQAWADDGDGDLAIVGITFDAAAGAFVIANHAHSLLLQGDIVNNDTNLQTLNFDFQLDGGDRTIHTTSGDIRIGGVISEDASARGLIKDGSSTLTLNSTAANTYSGGTTIDDGILSLGTGGGLTSHPDALGTGTVTVTSGGELRLWIENGGNFTIDNAVTLDGGTIHAEDGQYDITAAVSLVSTSTLSGKWEGKYLKVSGAISGAGGLIVDEAPSPQNGHVILSGSNTYSGTTTIDAGKLQLDAAGVIPDGTGKGDVTVTGTLDLNTYSETINGLSGAGTIDTIAGGTPTLTVGNDDDTTRFNGTLQDTAGTLALTKTGSGTQTLVQATSYLGATTIDDGRLILDANGSFTSYVGGQISINNGSVLQVQSNYIFHGKSFVFDANGGGEINIKAGNNVFRANTITTLGGIQNTISEGHMNCDIGPQTFTIADGTNETDLLVSATIGNSGDIVKDGAGTMALSAANTYTGETTVNGGTLMLDAPTAFYDYKGGQFNINTGATLRVQGSYFFQNDTFVFGTNGGGNIDIGSGNNVFRGDNTFTTLGGSQDTITQSSTFGLNCDGAGTRTFTVADGSDLVDLLISAVIANDGSVAKEGAGTMTLTADNTYSGTTTVNTNGGTLQVNNSSGSGTGSGAVKVNAAATLGGTGSMDGLVTVNSTGHIAPGMGIGTITMAGGLTLTDGSILDIEADSLGAADRIDITGGTFTGPPSADGVTLSVTFSGTPKQGDYVLMDWSAAVESGVDFADFDLVLTAPINSSYRLQIINDQLLLSVAKSMVILIR